MKSFRTFVKGRFRWFGHVESRGSELCVFFFAHGGGPYCREAKDFVVHDYIGTVTSWVWFDRNCKTPVESEMPEFHDLSSWSQRVNGGWPETLEAAHLRRIR